MNYLLPSIRFLVPIVALFLWAQVGWSQCGVSTTGTPSPTPIAAPTTIQNTLSFETRYANTAPAGLPANCIGCTTAPGIYEFTYMIVENDPCYDSDGDGDPNNDNFTYNQAVALGLFPYGADITAIQAIDGTDLTRMCPVDYQAGSATTPSGAPGSCTGAAVGTDNVGNMQTYVPTPPATCLATCADTDCDATNGNGVFDFTVNIVPAPVSDIPLANLPSSLGGVSTQFFDVDFYLDQNCQAEVRLAGTGWMAATTCGCRYVNYYDKYGEFLGREDIISGVATNPVPFILDGVNKNATSSSAGYPRVGDYIFFQADNGTACDSNTPNSLTGACSMAINRSSVFAFRIRNIFDDAPPVIKGSLNTSMDYCNPTLVTLSNNPTNINGDPRSDNNNTELTITDNDIAAGIGTGIGYDADGAAQAVRNDQTRALLCRELINTANTSGGVLPGGVFPDPYRFIYVLDYVDAGGDDTDQNTYTGTGYIDGTDPTNGAIGDIHALPYAGNTAVNQYFDALGNPLVGPHTFRPFTPDGCGGAVTVDYTDAINVFGRGDIYGLGTETLIDGIPATPAFDIPGTFTEINGVDLDAININNDIDFGEGGDGRFRECYSVSRRWTATDTDGNDAMCVQEIDITDDYEGADCRKLVGSAITIQTAGSPYFENVVLGGSNIMVTPSPTSPLVCGSAATVDNIYQESGYPTLYKYTNPAGAAFPDIVAPNFEQGTALSGGPGTNQEEHYNFPVFNYAEDMASYACSEAAILDGFTPSAKDDCGLLSIATPIETLYDYGLDGDFGDIGTNIFISTSVACPYWDNNSTPKQYRNNWPITYNPAPGAVNDQNQAIGTGMLNDDGTTSFTPADCEFYSYDLLRRWVVEDNCGFKSVAQRIYHVRDIEAPDASMTNAIQINGGAQGVSLTSNVYTSSAPGDTTNMKMYTVPTIINIPFAGCQPTVTVSTDYDDNCANDLYVMTTYDIQVAGGGTVVASGVPYTGTFTTVAGALSAGTNYTVTLRSMDPCGNTTDVVITVNTDPAGMSGCSDLSDVALTLSSGGTAQINSTQIMPTSSCIQTMLLNSCSLPSCVYLEMVVNGQTIAGDVVQTTSSYDLAIQDLSQIPTYVFNCSTGIFPATVNLYSVSPCVIPTAVNQPFNSTTQTRSLIGTHTRNVVVSPSPTASVTAIANPVDATSATATDGQIVLSLSSSFPGETFTIGYVPLVSGTPSGSVVTVTTTATAPTFSITGLAAGSYQVSVVGSQSCGVSLLTTTVGVSTPLQLAYNCPASVLDAQVASIPIFPTSSFSNMSTIQFGVTLNGPAGSTITGVQAVNGFAASSGGFSNGTHYFIDPSNTSVDIGWSGTPSQNLNAGIAFLTVQVSVPSGSAPGTLSISLDSGMSGTAEAQQDQGGGNFQMVNITFDPASMPCTSTINANTTANLSAGGSISFMNTGVGVSSTNVMLNNTTAGTMNSANTGSMPSTGAYSFTGITTGDNISITPSRTSGVNDNYVGLLDALILERYLAGQPVSSHNISHASQVIASDTDFDGDADFADVINIRKAAIFDPAFLYVRTDWLFYPTATTTFPAMPFVNYSAPLPQSFNSSMTASNMGINFTAVKLGDVNQSGQTLASPVAGVAVRSTTSFTTEDQALNAGSFVEIPVYAKDFNSLMGYQTNIKFDESYLNFESIELGTALPEIKMEDFGMSLVETGVIPAIWGGLTDADLKSGEVLFTLKFKVLKNSRSLKGLLDLGNTDFLKSTAYDSKLGEYQLGLDIISSEISGWKLYPSTPNPFTEVTKLGLEIPKASNVKLVISDLTGRVVYNASKNMDAGYNEFVIRKDNLSASGVYYYRVEANGYQGTGKMILID